MPVFHAMATSKVSTAAMNVPRASLSSFTPRRGVCFQPISVHWMLGGSGCDRCAYRATLAHALVWGAPLHARSRRLWDTDRAGSSRMQERKLVQILCVHHAHGRELRLGCRLCPCELRHLHGAADTVYASYEF
jgi:hypothetical protein